MTDNDVLNYFNKWKYIPWKRVKSEYKDYLLNRFKDTIFYENITDTLKECINRLKNNIEEIPKCPICGKPRKSYLYWYGQTCGNKKCSSKIQSETYLINIHKKYGCNINNYTQLDYVKEKIKQTCLKKYGSNSPLGNKNIWNETRKHIIEKYGAAYNKEKLNKTLIKKYGVPWFTLSDKLKEKTNTQETKEKQYNTKKKNHTFNTSIQENKTYELLKEKYSDVKYQYKSDVYPFVCDFYIPSLNLYIECNYHWTHGGKPYEGTDEDNIILEKWKSKQTKFYNNAINCWTIRDVNKRNIAKTNKLNYLEFFTILELEKWLNDGKNK